ncbi:MFS transporter [Kitasatospora sp. NPDC057541]|uniref:MFS transporter n=1 Tax=unclassified Kitasatospora TaxID=2633591 RepID=UPI003684D659
MALACGVAVANVYFPQALTPLIADGLDVPPGAAATIATAAQLGYAAGIFLLVPLGDRLPRRPLLSVLLAVTAAGLLAAALAPALGPLVAASAVVGAATVVPQLLVPMAAGLVDGARRGAVIGVLQAGLIAGVLLARTFGGLLGGALGWRAPYLVAAGLAVLLAVALRAALPGEPPAPARERPGYRRLLADTVRLLRTEPGLRRSAFYQACLFGGFSAVWTSLALLVTGPRYGYGPQAVGVFALLGAASVFCAPAAGRRADRYGADRVNLCCLLAALLAAAVLTAGSAGGPVGVAGLALGLLLLDAAVQANQVANQARLFALPPEIHSRLNTAYMTCSFLGGSAGSWLGVRAYGAAGWPGVCALTAAGAALALARALLPARRPSVRSAPSASPAPSAPSAPPASPARPRGNPS